MKLRYTIGLVGLALAGAIIGGCSANGSIGSTNPPVGQPSGSGPKQVAYKQIELLSRPAVKEAFEMFEDHDKTNRSEPYNDPVLQGADRVVCGSASATRRPRRRCRPCSIPTS